MDVRIKSLIEEVQETYGLNDYYLQRYSIDRQLNIFNETNYSLSMEWFPNHEAEQTEEELNPEGTAVVEIEVHSKRLEHIIFVGNTSYAQGVRFEADTLKEIIQWVERETDLIHGRDFQTDEVDNHKFRFIGIHKDIPVYPKASIEVKTDDSNGLIYFARNGIFPSKEMFEEDVYELSYKKIKNTVKEQITLTEWPDFETEQINVMYGLEEMFIKNDQTSTFPYDVIELPGSYVTVNKNMNTSPALTTAFEEKEIELTENIPIKEVFAQKSSPDAQTISAEDVVECEKRVQTFLRQVYANDDNDWELTILYREKGYINAILKNNKSKKQILQRKVVVFIDSESLDVLNYMDNNLMIKAMDAFGEAASIKTSKHDAFIKLENHIELTPYYVYDGFKQIYVLCGKIDCHYAVDAHTNELIDTKDM